MLRFLIVLLLFASTGLFAQIPITGTIVDSTNSPVIGAIIKCNSSNNFTTSDIDGRFSLYADTIDKHIDIQCLSYKKCSISIARILESNIIELETLPILLGAVEISANSANELLDKAFANTRKKLLLNRDINYLLHFTQLVDKENLADELYLKYSSRLEKTKSKQGHIPYKLKLNALKHIRNEINDTVPIFSFDYHESYILVAPKLDNYISTFNTSDNDSLLIIRIASKEKARLKKNGIFYINKSDTTIHSIDAELTNESLNKPYKKHKKIKYAYAEINAHIEYNRINQSLYLSKFNSSIKLHCITPKKEYDSSYFTDLKAISINDSNKNDSNIKLNGYSGELFNIPDTAISEFEK